MFVEYDKERGSQKHLSSFAKQKDGSGSTPV
jgi:hypothetical protein